MELRPTACRWRNRPPSRNCKFFRSACPRHWSFPAAGQSTCNWPRRGCAGAVASLAQANALWLPTITIGGDYYRHDGDIQDSSGVIVNNSHSSLMFGLGSGIGTAAVFSPNDAIFAAVAARQTLERRRSDVQAVTNDTMLAVTNAYFDVQEARGDLAAAQDATRRTQEIVRRVKSLAAGLVPELESSACQAELARRQETELYAREAWQVNGTELARFYGSIRLRSSEPD